MKPIIDKIKYSAFVLLFLPTITFGQRYDTIPQGASTGKYRFDLLLLCDSDGNIDYDNFGKINIIDKKKNYIHQTIDSVFIITAVGTTDNAIEIRDYNFDGYPDFRIVSFADMHGDNIDHDYYFYNPSTHKFSLISIGYRNTDGYWSNLTNGRFDPNNKKIYENIDYKAYSLSEVHNEYKWNGNSIELIKTDTIYFPPVKKLCCLLRDTTHIEEMYGQRFDDPWSAIFHSFPIKKKENAAIYLKLALNYSQNSSIYEYDPYYADENISEFIIQQIIKFFPKNKKVWVAYGDILYHKYLLTKDKYVLLDMEDAYQRYIEVMTKRGKKRKIPPYIYNRIKEREILF